MIERYDAYTGVVVGHNRRGIFIKLDQAEDQTVYAFHGASEFTRVLISILKPGNSANNKLPLAKVESILSTSFESRGGGRMCV